MASERKIMNIRKRLDVWLKVGLALNGLYVLLMLVFFVSGYLANRSMSMGEWSRWGLIYDIMQRWAGFLMMSDYVVMMRPLYRLMYIGQYLLIFVLPAFFAVMLAGAYLAATKQQKTGAILALAGSAGFFPLGIIGAIGAWRALKNSGDAESSLSEAGAGNRLPTVGDLFARSWTLYKSRFKTLLGVMLLATVLSIAIIIISSMIDRHSISVLVDVLSFDMHSVSRNLDHVVPLVPFYLVLASVLFWGTGAMVFAASPDQFTIRQSLGQAWKKLGQIIWLTVLTMFIVAGGYGLFIIPGLLFAVWVMFGLYAVAAGDGGGMNGLAISREYVRGRWWPVLFRFFLVWLIPMLILAVAGKFLASARSEASVLVIFACIVIFQALFTPFFIVYLYRLYLDLKETKKEPIAENDLKRSKSLLLRAGAAGWVAAAILAVLVIITSTTLSDAAYKGRTWMVRIKLAGASAEQINQAFARAVDGGRIDIARLLLDRGAGVNERYYGRTPLIMAAGRLDMAQLLIDRGADVNTSDDQGYTALMNASPEVARLLIERGADVNAANEDGSTPLMNAVKGFSYADAGGGDFISLLLERGAKVNAKDKMGNTALLYGLDLVLKSSYGSSSTIQMIDKLVSHGADVNVKNAEGVTPFMLVQYIENQEDAEKLKAMLKKAGVRR